MRRKKGNIVTADCVEDINTETLQYTTGGSAFLAVPSTEMLYSSGFSFISAKAERSIAKKDSTWVYMLITVCCTNIFFALLCRLVFSSCAVILNLKDIASHFLSLAS